MASTIDGELINIAEDTANANMVKDTVLQRLKEDNVLTEEQLKEYGNSWHIIIIKKGWFKNIIDRMGMDKTSSYFYRYVKFKL